MVKKKLTRKELLSQSDEFMTQTQRVISFVGRHPGKFIIGAAAALALLLTVMGIKVYMDRHTGQALAAYSEALAQANRLKSRDNKGAGEEIEAVLDALERVSTKYARTTPGRLVLLDLGTLYFHLKRYDEARYTYKKCLKVLKPEEESLRPFILDSLAYTYEAQNKLTEAAAQWEEIVRLPGNLLKEEAFLSLGRVYEALNEPEKAGEAYRQLIDRFPDSPHFSLASFKLKRVAPRKP
ncbi:MAG: tetratricopeptide repeat protein [Deltaproteobacteria bacterium]|nr:tetratricopeptide repeat protein [Deltaproteobacteria bacterium]